MPRSLSTLVLAAAALAAAALWLARGGGGPHASAPGARSATPAPARTLPAALDRMEVESAPAALTPGNGGRPEAWTPPAGSPLALGPPEDREAWRPTFEAFVAWYRSVPEFAELGDEDFAAAWSRPGLRAAWTAAREHQALRSFVGDYGARELARWSRGEPSVPLEEELRPVLGWLDEQLGDDDAVWSAINTYSAEALEHVHREGERAAQRDDPPSRWALQQALTTAASGPFERVAGALREVRDR